MSTLQDKLAELSQERREAVTAQSDELIAEELERLETIADVLEDQELAKVVRDRINSKSVRVTLDEL